MGYRSSICAVLGLFAIGCTTSADFSGTAFRCDVDTDCPMDSACVMGYCALAEEDVDFEPVGAGAELDASAVDGGVDSSDASEPVGNMDASPPEDTVPPPLPCVEGVQNVVAPSGRCFMYFDNDDINWDGARAACETLAGNAVLAQIEDANEFALVQPLFDGTRFDEVWFGANDMNQQMAWQWTDGTNVEYFSWKSGEPNNANDHCLVLDLDRSGNYDDRTCSDPAPYLCSRDAP